MGTARYKRIPAVGEHAPEFRLNDINGFPKSLAELTANGPVLLAFYKTTCPVCQFTFPFLDRIYRQRPSESLSVYAVSQDDANASRAFSTENRVTFPTLLDTRASGYPVSNAYGLSTVPAVFLVERDGTVSWSMEGFSRKDMETLGEKLGVQPFRPGERIPDWKAG